MDGETTGLGRRSSGTRSRVRSAVADLSGRRNGEVRRARARSRRSTSNARVCVVPGGRPWWTRSRFGPRLWSVVLTTRGVPRSKWCRAVGRVSVRRDRVRRLLTATRHRSSVISLVVSVTVRWLPTSRLRCSRRRCTRRRDIARRSRPRPDGVDDRAQHAGRQRAPTTGRGAREAPGRDSRRHEL